MTRILCASILALTLAAACDRNEPPATKSPVAQAPATPPAPPPAAPQAATEAKSGAPARTSGPYEILGVDLGTAVGPDGRIASPAGRLPSSETIHAVLQTEGRPEAMTLTARWMYNHQQNLATQTFEVKPGETTPPSFHITKQGGWPKGEYRIEIARGNDVVVGKDFVVE